jgi:succinate dehydrogenase / fumarate reductase flavoprotein subunit
MYLKITGENPFEAPMRIYPASHYTMGGLWVDYNLMSTLPGLHVIGEANFSDHGANRLGASALMQGLADGYFILPAIISHYLATTELPAVSIEDPAFDQAEQKIREGIARLLAVNGSRSVDSFHRQLGTIMWEHCGMSRNESGLRSAIEKIGSLRAEFWQDVRVSGENEEFNVSLEKAGRVADFLEFSELLVYDALARKESCGAHFREEHQSSDGEARRNDEAFAHVSAWEFQGVGAPPTEHREPLLFENVELATRSYK